MRECVGMSHLDPHGDFSPHSKFGGKGEFVLVRHGIRSTYESGLEVDSSRAPGHTKRNFACDEGSGVLGGIRSLIEELVLEERVRERVL